MGGAGPWASNYIYIQLEIIGPTSTSVQMDDGLGEVKPVKPQWGSTEIELPEKVGLLNMRWWR